MANISTGAMHSRNRASVAELHVGAFREEVSWLSPRARRAHWAAVCVSSVLFAWLMYFVLISPYWLPDPHPQVEVIDSLSLSYSGDESAGVYALPHRTLPLQKRFEEGVLTAQFDMATGLADNTALYIPIHFNALAISLNGTWLLASQAPSENPLEMVRRSSFYLLPNGLLRESDNHLKIRLARTEGRWLEMSKIYVGSHLPLQYQFGVNQFISNAILWLVLLASVWAVISVLTLLYLGGSSLLLMSLPLACLATIFCVLQLADSPWSLGRWHISLSFLASLTFVIASALVSHRQWRGSIGFRLALSANCLISFCALVGSHFSLLNEAELSLFFFVLLMLSVFVLVVFLLYIAVQKIIREGWQSLDPFLLQVLHSRFVVVILNSVLLLSVFGVIGQVPLALVNIFFFTTLYNNAVLSLLSGLSRTQELADYRQNMRSKLEQQERHLWALSHEHLEAMRWTVIGRSAMTLVEKIRAPLIRIAGDLMVLKLDSKFAQNKTQWDRLKRSTNRCVKHTNVIESLVQEDHIQPSSFRLDLFVSRCMLQLQEQYHFSWEMQTDIKGWIEADSHLLENVVESLVDNANHSSLAAGRELELQLVLAREGSNICLSIQDNGAGVDADVNVFEPFHSSRAFGLGLGVNLAQKHLWAMGGHLTLEPSQLGAKFCIHLPIGTVV